MGEINTEAIHWQQRYDTVLRECETHQDIIGTQTRDLNNQKSDLHRLNAHVDALQVKTRELEQLLVAEQAAHAATKKERDDLLPMMDADAFTIGVLNGTIERLSVALRDVNEAIARIDDAYIAGQSLVDLWDIFDADNDLPRRIKAALAAVTPAAPPAPGDGEHMPPEVEQPGVAVFTGFESRPEFAAPDPEPRSQGAAKNWAEKIDIAKQAREAGKAARTGPGEG